jgi:RNA polymerase sigma factor (sigma-70 family)
VVADFPAPATDSDAAWFEDFASSSAVRLRQVLIARYGVEAGCDTFSMALLWAWEHRDRLRGMGSPVGYLFRVAQSEVRPELRWQRRVVLVDVDEPVDGEHLDVDLVRALARLSGPQRTAVVLVHAYGWSYAEVADALGVSVAAVTNHVHRGLRKLRGLLGEP